MRPPSPSIPEHDFTLEALRQALRVDGRRPNEMRALSIEFGSELGWVECALGKTRVVAYVDAKMTKPPAERPLEGIISVHTELSPMASSEYELGRTSDEEVTITRMLDKILRRSDAIDKESLCILAGERVWHIRLTIHFLADAGNMLDCASIAGMTALRHFRRPDVEVVGDEVIVHSPASRAPIPLSLSHHPLSLTFASFSLPPSTSSTNPPTTSLSSSTSTTSPSPPTPLLLDPTLLEHALSTGTISLALTSSNELFVLHKAGGVPLAVQQVLEMIREAAKRVKEVEGVVEGRLREDWARRGGLVEVR